jgi:hypothetical protein
MRCFICGQVRDELVGGLCAYCALEFYIANERKRLLLTYQKMLDDPDLPQKFVDIIQRLLSGIPFK